VQRILLLTGAGVGVAEWGSAGAGLSGGVVGVSRRRKQMADTRVMKHRVEPYVSEKLEAEFGQAFTQQFLPVGRRTDGSAGWQPLALVAGGCGWVVDTMHKSLIRRVASGKLLGETNHLLGEARHPQRTVSVMKASRNARTVASTPWLLGMPRPYGAAREHRRNRGSKPSSCNHPA
jgi:hypothetical protein